MLRTSKPGCLHWQIICTALSRQTIFKLTGVSSSRSACNLSCQTELVQMYLKGCDTTAVGFSDKALELIRGCHAYSSNLLNLSIFYLLLAASLWICFLFNYNCLAQVRSILTGVWSRTEGRRQKLCDSAVWPRESTEPLLIRPKVSHLSCENQV